MARVGYLLAHRYTWDGDWVAPQAMGIPMAIKPGPHFANITCYPQEKKYVLHTRMSGQVKRFIDDIWACDREPPGEDVYQMKYKRTSTDTKDVTFIRNQVEVSTSICITLSGI